MKSQPYINVRVDVDGSRLLLGADTSDGATIQRAPLAGLALETLQQFAANLRRLAQNAKPLDPQTLQIAQQLHESVYSALGEQLARMGANDDAVLVRWFCSDSTLHQIPWEAMARPGERFGFMAVSHRDLFTRAVHSEYRAATRMISGAVRVLVVAPEAKEDASRIERALSTGKASGEIDWLPPLIGERALGLLEALRSNLPHILHFVGHGRSAPSPGILLGRDSDNEEKWLDAEILAQCIISTRGALRLAVLEACEGAAVGDFGSSAECLGRVGVDGVIAHLWPVASQVAARCTKSLYAALAGQREVKGDVARAINEARLDVLANCGGSAEAFSPVLYLRTPNSTLFDMSQRIVVPPNPLSDATANIAAVSPALASLLESPFSLLLGDFGTEVVDNLRRRLRAVLEQKGIHVPEDLPLSALAQRVAFASNQDTLSAEFQEACGPGNVETPLVAALAARVGPGVHTTLLRQPLFEKAVARLQPQRTVYVVQPTADTPRMWMRAAGSELWESVYDLHSRLDITKDLLILRLHRGYSPGQVFLKPMLTEDDFLSGFSDLERAMGDASYHVLNILKQRPALIVGVTALLWNHRILFQNLFVKGPATGSIAVIDPESHERSAWERQDKDDVGGRSRVSVLESSSAQLTAWLMQSGPRK